MACGMSHIIFIYWKVNSHYWIQLRELKPTNPIFFWENWSIVDRSLFGPVGGGIWSLASSDSKNSQQMRTLIPAGYREFFIFTPHLYQISKLFVKFSLWNLNGRLLLPSLQSPRFLRQRIFPASIHLRFHFKSPAARTSSSTAWQWGPRTESSHGNAVRTRGHELAGSSWSGRGVWSTRHWRGARFGVPRHYPRWYHFLLLLYIFDQDLPHCFLMCRILCCGLCAAIPLKYLFVSLNKRRRISKFQREC